MPESKRDDNTLLLVALVLALSRDDYDYDPFLYTLAERILRRDSLHDPDLQELLEWLLGRRFHRRQGFETRYNNLMPERARPRAKEPISGEYKAWIEFFQGFQEKVETRIKTLEDRVDGVENERRSVLERLDELAAETTEIGYGLHEFIWQLSTGANIEQTKTIRYVPLRLFLGDPIPDEKTRQDIVSAVEQLFAPLGFERSYELADESGSWWKKLLLRTRDFFTSSDVQRRLRTAEEAIEAHYLDKPQAEANHLQAGAAAQLIAALGTTPNACIQVGTLLLVKATTPDGQSAVITRTLTKDELRRIEENQAMLKRPEQVLEWLQTACHGQKRLPSG